MRSGLGILKGNEDKDQMRRVFYLQSGMLMLWPHTQGLKDKGLGPLCAR